MDALRLTPLQRVGSDFTRRLEDLRTSTGRLLPAVGEYWRGDVRELEAYLHEAPNAMLFDALHCITHSQALVSTQRRPVAPVGRTRRRRRSRIVRHPWRITTPSPTVLWPLTVASWFKAPTR